ncbi:MAG: UDP-2,3-diacylglucosamine diphosphatase LpxI [Candidatus Omnitrophica bacterium]|nr:UDP-2,3-diacylglucosamine diphosphatase LpxI [Candidatus Omnitrophota bacterium]MBU4488241.1 UDP-2,3-diacylglucosamine diphosphatase LpxI [Candidatus Omnitrophota bacterium]MCG2704689.1 UDP-2,3-diacylglucosamine diphosphatase LpxI [Candidatus Omnitrophota bacterium]
MKRLEKIGLFAGGGELPLVFGDEVRKGGTKVVAFAANGITSKDLDGHVDKIYWLELTETAKLPFIFLSERLKNFVMLGKIPKTILFKKDLSRSKEISSVLSDAKDHLDDNLMREIANKAKKFGINFLNPADFLQNLLPEKGVLTKRKPTRDELQDIEFGRKIAAAIGNLDIGQAVAVKNKDVVAVEALEGTDEMIKRAGKLAGNGVVFVKMIKPKQDPRFDMPTVGVTTIDSLIEAKAAVLAIEAGKTFFVNKNEAVKRADSHGISIVAI